ncbi:MAG: hypothetical protein K8R06_07905 [Methanosarcinales archaeon]|nr:hypothetical protein [Methanosarcinales archaeon]MCD4816305.1 hypothetical protein [Methanosarcinales archaeon]
MKTKLSHMETHVELNKVWLYKDEYDDMLEYIDRLTETINVLSDRSTTTAVKQALSRINSGEYLTKEDMVFD